VTHFFVRNFFELPRPGFKKSNSVARILDSHSLKES
jgi:hypothetical protein